MGSASRSETSFSKSGGRDGSIWFSSNRKNPRDSDLRKAQIWGLEKKAGPRAIGELTRSLSLGKKKDMGVFGNSLRPFLLSLGFVWAQTPSPSGLKF